MAEDLVTIRRSGVTKHVSRRSLATFTRAGYEIVEGEETPSDQSETPVAVSSTLAHDNPNGPSIQEIYDMCDKAGVNPADVTLPNENPTLTEVKAAIKAAKPAKA